MAIDTAMYSPKQFMLSILPETTLGTKNVTSMHLINLEGYPSITRGVTRVLDVRHGVGQTAKKQMLLLMNMERLKKYLSRPYTIKQLHRFLFQIAWV